MADKRTGLKKKKIKTPLQEETPLSTPNTPLSIVKKNGPASKKK